MYVAEIVIYPIKACGGVSLPVATLAPGGLAHDRRWMIVDETGRFISQRELPQLSLIATKLSGRELELQVSRAAPLSIPLDGTGNGRSRLVTVWADTVEAVEHQAGSAWLSALFQRACSLVYMPEQSLRQVNPERARPGDTVSFADAYPLLVISEASLDDLNARLAMPIGMRRFRPNIVVGGAQPYAEDHWSRVRMGELTFRGVKPCDRCVVTTIDPDRAEKGTEPLKTLATYRKWDGKVWFGMNMIHDGSGALRVGDEVVPLQ